MGLYVIDLSPFSYGMKVNILFILHYLLFFVIVFINKD